MRRFLLLLVCLSKIVYGAETTATVHEYSLQNGLKVIVKKDHRAPVVFASVWYKVGSSYEPQGLTGISHALEHMMFRGTHRYGPGKLSEIINANGGEQNAITSHDFTIYFQTLPANKLAVSFQLEADRMVNLTLDKDAFAKEIQVVMEERRMRTEDNPQAFTMERFNAIAFINNPYNHPVIGWMSDLQQMNISELRDWYRQWYAPNNAVIIVVGDVNPAEVLALAKQYFGDLPAKKLPTLRPTQAITDLGLRQLQVSIPAQLPWVVLGYNTPSLTTAPQSTDPYALMVLAYILGGSDSSRLNRTLVRQQQLAVSASADYNIYNLYDNLLTISATPAKSITSDALQNALQAQVQQLQTTLVSPQELARAKALLIAAHAYAQDSLANQAFDLGLPEVTGLSWRQENGVVARIQNVTAQQIQAVAKRYLIPERLTIGALDPAPRPGGSPSRGELHDNSAIH